MAIHDTASALDTFGITPGACVSLIGGGGKTSTMMALAGAAAALGWTVALTTTTRMWPPPETPLCQSPRLDALAPLTPAQPAAFASARDPDGKLLGLPPSEVCRLHTALGADLLLVEADGSKGRRVKVHGPHEPVVAACTSHLLCVLGVSALGQPASDDSVHRMTWAHTVGLAPGATIEADAAARVLQRCATFAPPGAIVQYVLNGVDNSARQEAADQVRVALRTLGDARPVIDTVRGLPAPASRQVRA